MWNKPDLKFDINVAEFRPCSCIRKLQELIAHLVLSNPGSFIRPPNLYSLKYSSYRDEIRLELCGTESFASLHYLTKYCVFFTT